MEVRVFGNTRRPGVGMSPRREGSRPLLPQHARHCPVLEAGSALGFMVYASLEPKESLYVEFEGDGRFKFVYYLQTQDGKRAPIFQVTMSLSVGGVGMMKEDVTFVGAPMLSREAALAVMRAFLVPEDMGTPTGRDRPSRRDEFPDAAWLGHGLLANPEHDRAAGRADADQFASRPTGTRTRPSSVTCCSRGRASRSSTASRSGRSSSCRANRSRCVNAPREELKTIEASRDEFHRHKTAATQQTSYGLSYSPHYLRQSRAVKEQ